MIRAAVVLAVVSGCLEPATVECGDEHHTLCASDSVCARIPELGSEGAWCVDPSAVEACSGAEAGTACTVDGHGGTCFATTSGAVCVPQACGDRLRDGAESCDDGNQASADGCAADCLSDETCGNGAIDAVNAEQCDDANLRDHDGCTSTCQREVATWTLLDINNVEWTRNAAVAFDLVRAQGVMFGGGPEGGGEDSADTWLWNGKGWIRGSPMVIPPERHGHVMAYDAARDRVVLFGGANAQGVFADTWEWDGRTWTRRSTPTFPPERQGASMVYDSARKRVVLFGGVVVPAGIGAPHYYGDTWEWDGTQWTERVLTPRPAPRALASMAYDPRRGRVVLFSGRNGIPPFDLDPTMWEYDGVRWEQVTWDIGPTSRLRGAMAWDVERQGVLLFGGAGTDATGGGVLGDVWSWDGAAWTAITATAPFARDGHAMFSDPFTRTVVLAGGSTPNGPTKFSTSLWDGTAWRAVDLTDPMMGRDLCGALDVTRGVAVIVGSDHRTWETDGHGWIKPASPDAELTCKAMAYDPVRQRTVLVGLGDLELETRAWDGATWTTVQGPQPTLRTSVSMAFDAARGHIVLFGGGAGADLDDTWLFDANGWHLATPAHHPAARSEHVMAYDPVRAEVVLFGGTSAQQPLGDVWAWTGTDWQPRPTATAPAPRARAAMAWNPLRRRLVLFGGLSGTSTLQDTWEWTGTAWELVGAATSPAHRSSALLLPSPRGDGVLLVDGQGANLNQQRYDRWLLRWEGETAGEVCVDAAADLDADGLAGCADQDCWARCAPRCSPLADDAAPCTLAPRCGDGACNSALESCRSCPDDCGACIPLCGDGVASPGETMAACPGDR